MTFYSPCIFFFFRDLKKKKNLNVKTNEIKENDKQQEVKNNT